MGIKEIASVAKRYAPELLLVAGSVGFVGTIVLTAKSAKRIEHETKDVAEHIRNEMAEEKPVPKVAYAAKRLAPVYLPIVGISAATLGCFYAAHGINVKRIAEVSSAYTLLSTTFDSYKDKVTERFQATAKDILGEVVEDEEPEHQEAMADQSVFWEGSGDTRVFDRVTGRKFLSTPAQIREAEAGIAKALLDCEYTTLNDFYDRLGLEAYTRVGDALGWGADICPIDIDFKSGVDTDGKPYLVIVYDTHLVNRAALLKY